MHSEIHSSPATQDPLGLGHVADLKVKMRDKTEREDSERRGFLNKKLKETDLL